MVQFSINFTFGEIMRRTLKGISLCIGFILSLFVLTTCFAASGDDGSDNTMNSSSQTTDDSKNQPSNQTSGQNSDNNTHKSPNGDTDTSY